MKVYAVIWFDYDDHKLLSITSTRDNAEKIKTAYGNSPYTYIKEMIVDSLPGYYGFDEFFHFIRKHGSYSIGGYLFKDSDEYDRVDVYDRNGVKLFSACSGEEFKFKSKYYDVCQNIRICETCGRPVEAGYTYNNNVEYCSDEELINDICKWSDGSEVRKIGEHKYEWKPFTDNEWEETDCRWKDSFE